jgi:hypothetical protein
MVRDPAREERQTRLPDRQTADVAAAVPQTGRPPGGVMPGISALLAGTHCCSCDAALWWRLAWACYRGR